MIMEVGRVSKLMEQHDTLVLGISQTFGLKDFAHDVEQAIPGCRVTPENSKWSWVYMPGDHYAMGMIGYGDFRDSGDGTSMYTVKSRNIANGKYSDHSHQHHMTMSVNRGVAVKNARAYLRRYTPHETARFTLSAVRHELSLAHEAARTAHFRALNTALGATRVSSKLLTELQTLLDTGHSFVDPTFAEELREALAASAAYDQYKNATPMNFVQILPYQGTQRWDVVPVDKLEHYTPEIGDVQSYIGDAIEAEVSEDIRGKVAVCNMLKDETYVEGVGYKLFDGIYYVAR